MFSLHPLSGTLIMKQSITVSATRLSSLDQFRGYTVAAMFLVNFLGDYRATPALLRHHNTWCSYADTVMPQFFFAVGMALRLVMLREEQSSGRGPALARGVRRGLLLMLAGFMWYHPWGDFDPRSVLAGTATWEVLRDVFLVDSFQALTHIGAATLWVLPVMTRGAGARVMFAVLSAGLHLLLSHVGWYTTLHQWSVIDGGPLGFLTWTLPVVAGSLALDVVRSTAEPSVRRLLCGGAAVMLAGYGLACLTQGGVIAAPPFVPPWHSPDLWTMSQRAGSGSYLLFSAGFSLAVYAGFVWWSDRRGGRLGLFSDLGQNALAAYLIHMLIMGPLSDAGSKDSPLWYAVALSSAGFLVSWAAVRWLNARGLFLRM
jgi:predicted acyltransferase